MKHILLIKNIQENVKPYNKINNKIIWYINNKTNNTNRVFFPNRIDYIIIFYNEYNDNLKDLMRMKKQYDNMYMNNNKGNLILYCYIRDIEIKNAALLYYINSTFDIKIITNKNTFDKFINDLQ
jgi:hypothetical protein